MNAKQAELLDKLACRTLMETYSYAEIIRDPDLFASVFTEDARFGTLHGRDAIRQGAVEFFKPMESITELRVSPAGWYVTINGDEADGRFHTVNQLKIPQADGKIRILHIDASWIAKFVRDGDGWLIADLGGIKDTSLLHDSDIFIEVEGMANWPSFS